VLGRGPSKGETATSPMLRMYSRPPCKARRKSPDWAVFLALSPVTFPTIASGAPEVALSEATRWLAGAISAGGVLGPLPLMVGLARTDAAITPHILTLEGVATALSA